MHLRIADDVLRLRFQHDPPMKGRIMRSPRGKLVKASTRCYIERRTGGDLLMAPEWRRLGIGSSWCSYDDRWEKEKGRRIALTRALEGWDRDHRRKVWEAYWEAKNAVH